MTAAQVQAASGKYLLRDNRTVGLFLPEQNPQRAEVPAVASAAELLKDYKPKQTVVDAEVFDSSPENIERRVHRSEINGMKLALLSKKNRGETVFFQMSLPAGDEEIAVRTELRGFADRADDVHGHQSLLARATG